MNNSIGVKGLWDIPLAWVGSITTLTFISTIVGILAGISTIALTVYRMYLLHKDQRHGRKI